MKGRFPITNLSGKHDTERFCVSEYPDYVPSGLDVAPFLTWSNPQLTITVGPRELPIPRKLEGGRYGHIPEPPAILEPIEGVRYG